MKPIAATKQNLQQTQNIDRNTRVPLKKTIKLLGKNWGEEELTGKNYKNNWETSNKLEISTNLSIIMLNVSGLNTPMKRHRVGGLDNKTRPIYRLLQETHF